MLAYLKLAAIAGVLAGAAYGGYQVRDWQADADDLARERASERQRIRNADRADWGARSFEEERDAIRRDLLASLPPAALSAPVPQCPAVAVGDIVLPAGALTKLRAAAGVTDQ